MIRVCVDVRLCTDKKNRTTFYNVAFIIPAGLSFMGSADFNTDSFFFFRYPYGQSGPVPAVCYLNILLPGHESFGLPFWLTVGLPEQHGELHSFCFGHLPVKKCGVGHCNGRSHWLCIRHTADSALHAHLPLPQGERGA